MQIFFFVAGKPMAKARVRFSKAGHAFTPERTVNYEGQLAYAAQVAMNGAVPIEGPVSASVRVYMPIAPSWSKKKREAALTGAIRPTSKPDADNYAKMLDALNHIVWVDDSQVVDLRVVKEYSLNPRMEIIVDTLDETSVTE